MRCIARENNRDDIPFGPGVPDLDSRITRKEAELREIEAAIRLLEEGTRPEEMQQCEKEQERVRITEALLGQTIAEHAARATLGTGTAQQELARRAKEQEEEIGKLDLLLAGSREEEVDAERAKLGRVDEELKYLQELAAQRPIRVGQDGIVVIPRLRRKSDSTFRKATSCA
ncbi:MAG: hypothetical protein AB7F89_17720 [Pirellulaceae bacterium]